MCYSILKGPFHVLSLLVLDEELTSVILDVGIAAYLSLSNRKFERTVTPISTHI
jgi:hypothetical protein